MSLLNCPVCQAAMREVNKAGVLIDTCTQCRGVWLDRGELEKLAGMMDRDDPDRGAARDSDRLSRHVRDERRDDRIRGSRDWNEDDDGYDERRSRDPRDERPQQSRMSRLFDFFD